MYWQRLQEGSFYRHGNMKEWEVYGRADIPPANDTWEGWTLLRKCEFFKPSGLPPGEGSFTQEDIDYAVKGEEFEFPSDIPPVRYIRFKVLGSFDDIHTIHFSEISFFGQIVEEMTYKYENSKNNNDSVVSGRTGCMRRYDREYTFLFR
ncbi:MAG: hypothetical protein LUD15_10560 [Bacteroides sp.]|nr:hypothetical protein [Bacteroides sp.]